VKMLSNVSGVNQVLSLWGNS